MEDRKNLTTLKDNLTLVIQKQVKNIKLLQAMNEEFINKGFEIEIPSMLFNREIEIEAVRDNELIAVNISIYNFFKDKDLDKELKTNNKTIDIIPSHYFSDAELTSYELYEKQKENKVPDIIEFENCTKIDTNIYWVFNKAPKLAKLRSDRKIAYFKNIQRATKKYTTPTGDVIEKINVNKDGIKSLKNRFKKHNIKPTTITLSILRQPKKKPYVKFDSKDGVIGTLFIKPVFDRNSDEYAPLIINDGNHRYTGLCDAYDEDGNKVKDEGLGTFIMILNEDEARQFTADTFEQNSTDVEKKHAETLKNTDENKFARSLELKSEILRDEVTSIIRDCKVLDKLTYMNILIDSAKYTGIDLTDEITSEGDIEIIANTIDMIIKYISSKYFDKDINKMKDHNFLLKPNMFAGYIAIGNILKDSDNYKRLAGEVSDKLIQINEDLNKKLKLDMSDCNVERIYKYFENIAKEVI